MPIYSLLQLRYCPACCNGSNTFFSFVFIVLQRAFFYFLCTVSGCDGGNRTRNIAVYTWRPLSYDRHPKVRPSPWSTTTMALVCRLWWQYYNCSTGPARRLEWRYYICVTADRRACCTVIMVLQPLFQPACGHGSNTTAVPICLL